MLTLLGQLAVGGALGCGWCEHYLSIIGDRFEYKPEGST